MLPIPRISRNLLQTIAVFAVMVLVVAATTIVALKMAEEYDRKKQRESAVMFTVIYNGLDRCGEVPDRDFAKCLGELMDRAAAAADKRLPTKDGIKM